MTWMVRNSEGKRDAVLTMTLVGFAVILLKFLLAGVTVGSFTFGDVDATVIGALLTPTMGAYVARRYTDKKHGNAVPSEPDVDTWQDGAQ